MGLGGLRPACGEGPKHLKGALIQHLKVGESGPCGRHVAEGDKVSELEWALEWALTVGAAVQRVRRPEIGSRPAPPQKPCKPAARVSANVVGHG